MSLAIILFTLLGEGDGDFDLDDMPVPQIFPDLVRLSPREKLGKLIFFDTTLSDPDHGETPNSAGQACATCHAVNTGFMGPSSRLNKIAGPVPGVVEGRVGKRLVPSISYKSSFSPIGPRKAVNADGENVILGGIMWDNRFKDVFGVQAFVDPDEQHNTPTPDPLFRLGYSKVLAGKIKNRPYASLFNRVYGQNAVNKDARTIFINVMKALQTYIVSLEVNPFSSKFDAAHFHIGGIKLTSSEQRGKDLFFGRAGCSNCHSSVGVPTRIPVPGNRELFTAFCSVNIGIPKNPGNPFYTAPDNSAGGDFVDFGLGMNGFPGTDGEAFYDSEPGDKPEYRGLFMVPTLRNANRRPNGQFVKAFGHNGFFKSLEDFVHFVNERNVAISDKCDPRGHYQKKVFDLRTGPPKGFHAQFPPPEVMDNVENIAGNSPDNAQDDTAHNGEVGNLGLDDQNEADLVAFIKTLDDGYTYPNP
jgi:cytochrome c peroxidase